MRRKHNPELTNLARSLRKNMTKEERHLWYDYLRQYPVRFVRQKVIDSYIVDFYCHDARLIVELDGSQHYIDEGIENDEDRTAILQKRNLLVVRIDNLSVNTNFDGVCEYIDKIVKERLSPHLD
ncbi:MAG TPA: endonuclease domain-containing protein [Clostridiales bacterium]|nr:MAG: hypothetical protein BWY37_01286 [Firmicutes bacterium ADurb.Bin262]HOU09837.1 endonuclease domain-containing protein [Clostridiales bacterium]HQK72204.1 endonuclease domain-containing protein [Clostridiales bacterium]